LNNVLRSRYEQKQRPAFIPGLWIRVTNTTRSVTTTALLSRLEQRSRFAANVERIFGEVGTLIAAH